MDDNGYLILRRSPRWIYRFRRFDIMVDGQKVGSIANDSEETVAIMPGSHEVELKVSWIFKSEVQKIEINAGEKVSLECGTPITIVSMLPLLLGFFLLNILRHFKMVFLIASLLFAIYCVSYCISMYRGRGKFIYLKNPQNL